MDPTVILGVLVLLIIGVIPVAFLSRWAEVRTPALLSYGAHVIVAFFLYGRRGLSTAPDAVLYDEQARQYASHGHVYLNAAGKDGWPRLLGWLYVHVSPTPLLGLVVNASLAAMTLCFVAAAAHELTPQARTPSVWMLMICPGYWYWGVLLLREPSSWLLISVIGWGSLRLIRSPAEARAWAVIVTGTAGLLWIRGPLALIVGIGALTGLAVSRGRRFGKIVGVACFAVLSYFLLGSKIRDVTQFGTPQIDLSRSALESSRSGFTGSVLSTVPRVLVGPYPTEWLPLGVKVVPDVLYTLVITVFAIIAFRGYRRAIVLVTPAIGLVAALAIGSGNYGTMIRLRAEVMILLIPLAACFVADWRSRVLDGRSTKSSSADSHHTRSSPERKPVASLVAPRADRRADRDTLA